MYENKPITDDAKNNSAKNTAHREQHKNHFLISDAVITDLFLRIMYMSLNSMYIIYFRANTTPSESPKSQKVFFRARRACVYNSVHEKNIYTY